MGSTACTGSRSRTRAFSCFPRLEAFSECARRRCEAFPDHRAPTATRVQPVGQLLYMLYMPGGGHAAGAGRQVHAAQLRAAAAAGRGKHAAPRRAAAAVARRACNCIGRSKARRAAGRSSAQRDCGRSGGAACSGRGVRRVPQAARSAAAALCGLKCAESDSTPWYLRQQLLLGDRAAASSGGPGGGPSAVLMTAAWDAPHLQQPRPGKRAVARPGCGVVRGEWRRHWQRVLKPYEPSNECQRAHPGKTNTGTVHIEQQGSEVKDRFRSFFRREEIRYRIAAFTGFGTGAAASRAVDKAVWQPVKVNLRSMRASPSAAE